MELLQVVDIESILMYDCGRVRLFFMPICFAKNCEKFCLSMSIRVCLSVCLVILLCNCIR